ncbi:NDP-sugar synthase [Entomospira nematocerorum]|uniref:NDP-sugar synthase n=1 Tax=Entomospira nematocerorum TaxID=2719987 RepID=A0A968KSJ7_9SPIO|nr:NDP-sugar synthase [Entomospira nematocera]NIZ46635.1 NDP-sugar synthase [Entomospira nematocera]WDI33567.1 NDP-sugar synthase [Entomospira nematocera]
MTNSNPFEVLVLSGGKARRLSAERKIINKADFPELTDYWNQEGPKGLTLLNIHNSRIPLLDLHMQPYMHNSNITNITLGLGFASEMIIAYYQDKKMPVPISFTTEANPAGTIAPLLKMYELGHLANTPLLLANGDNLLQFDIDMAIQHAYQYATMLQDPEKGFVLNILTTVPHKESSAYGVVDYDPLTHNIYQFLEKQAVTSNPFFIENNQAFSYINSGFSIIFYPKNLIEHFVDDTIFRTMRSLENLELEYKKHETIVKYETLYAQIAQAGRLFGEPIKGFWADSGTEDQIQRIEAYYRRKESK